MNTTGRNAERSNMPTLFFQNPSQSGKNILDLKCNIKLTVHKGTLDKHKASSVADPLHNIPLFLLKDLPEQPTILKGFDTSKFNLLLTNRLENHIITNNKLINSSIEKGCMEKMPGCWEHM